MRDARGGDALSRRLHVAVWRYLCLWICSLLCYLLLCIYRKSFVVEKVVCVTPMLVVCFNLDGGLGGKPEGLWRIVESDRSEPHFGMQRAKPHIFHAGIDVGGQLGNGAGYRVDPCGTVKVQRI